jgi:hypothetical protein
MRAWVLLLIACGSTPHPAKPKADAGYGLVIMASGSIAVDPWRPLQEGERRCICGWVNSSSTIKSGSWQSQTNIFLRNEQNYFVNSRSVICYGAGTKKVENDSQICVAGIAENAILLNSCSLVSTCP